MDKAMYYRHRLGKRLWILIMFLYNVKWFEEGTLKEAVQVELVRTLSVYSFALFAFLKDHAHVGCYQQDLAIWAN